MLMAVLNMTVLTTMTTITGPANAQIKPLSEDNQQLKKSKVYIYVAIHNMEANFHGRRGTMVSFNPKD